MKPTQALAKNMARKLQLTGKTGPKNFYKGWGSGSMGEHTKYGGYKINYDKVRSYVVPDGLDKFKLTPFVTEKVKPMRGKYAETGKPITGEYYLGRWKQENGED